MKALGGIEAQFFAYIQMMEIRTVKTGDIQTALGLSSEQERQLLSRLSGPRGITVWREVDTG
jgi:hypothetical protein